MKKSGRRIAAEVLPQCTVFRVFLNGTDERTSIGQLKGTLSETIGTSIDCTCNEAQMERATVRLVFHQAASERNDIIATLLGTDALSGKEDFLLCKGKRTKRIQGPTVTPEECGKIADYLRASN